jgi:hypothetical protein
MAVTTIATLPTPWQCKWSRPGLRPTGVPDRLQPETSWVCAPARVTTSPRRNAKDASSGSRRMFRSTTNDADSGRCVGPRRDSWIRQQVPAP